MEQSLETFQALDPKGYLRKFTDSNVRPDARPLHAARPTTVIRSVLTRNSRGSSLLRLGKTQVLTAATLTIGRPPAALPKSGEIDVTLSIGPLCGGRYNARGDAIDVSMDGGDGFGGGATFPKTSAAASASDPAALSSYVRRTIVSSGIVDPEDLCLREGIAAWRVQLTCVLLNHDGNVADACILGCVAALSDLRLPPVQWGNDVGGDSGACGDSTLSEREDGVGETARILETEVEGEDSGGSRFLLRTMPVPLTVGLFGGKMLVDPTLTEEAVCEGTITVVVDAFMSFPPYDESKSNEDVNRGATILGLQKTGTVMVSTDELAICVRLASGRAKEMKQILV